MTDMMHELPEHFPISVNEQGQGPTEPDPPFRVKCWCIEEDCMWTQALIRERAKGYAEGIKWASYMTELNAKTMQAVSDREDPYK